MDKSRAIWCHSFRNRKSLKFVVLLNFSIEYYPFAFQPQNIIKLLESSYIDGTIYCRVERDATSLVRGKRFDLINDKLHVLVASGTVANSSQVGYHDIGRIASSEPRALSVIAEFKGASKLLLRLHGAFMLVAWIGTASIGILMARYFKQTWVGSSLCGKDQWFAVSIPSNSISTP